MAIALRLTKVTQAVDGLGRPLSGDLTVNEAAGWMAAHDADMPLYVEAHFSVVRDVPVTVGRQVAMFTRRLAAISKGCGRRVMRVEPQAPGSVLYRALLAR